MLIIKLSAPILGFDFILIRHILCVVINLPASDSLEWCPALEWALPHSLQLVIRSREGSTPLDTAGAPL